jgi:thioredoxin reductase
MFAWSHQMPKGMRLKSDGFASSLSDPASEFTLARYSSERGLPYHDTDLPVPIETFIDYGIAFQKRFVSNLENTQVKSIERIAGGFEVKLEHGECVRARKVVVAVGISKFARVPEVFSDLPEGLVSHSSAHVDLEGFKGRRVAVVGAGSSAVDLAVLLKQVGASVEIVARGPELRFHHPPARRTLKDRMMNPITGIGPGLDFLFYVKAPQLFRLLPEKLRLNRVKKTLGPAAGWFVRDEVAGKIPVHLNTSVTRATAHDGRLRLDLTDGQKKQTLEVDHVISATGYRIDIGRLDLLSSDLRRDIRRTGTSPLLSAHFESSIPGLYFVGVASANTFGPMMRFAYGDAFAAKRVSRHLAKSTSKSPVLLSQPDRQQIFE